MIEVTKKAHPKQRGYHYISFQRRHGLGPKFWSSTMIRIASLLRNRVTHTRSKRNHNHNNSLFGISPSVNNARGRGAFGLAITGFALASAGQGNIESMKFEKSQVISFPGSDCLNVTVLCDAGNLSRPGESDSSYEEAEEFIQCLHYYRQQLPWYRKQWSSKNQNPISANWPRNIPSMKETSALELDLKFCQRNPRSPQNDKKCQNLQFRIASCYIRSRDPKLQYRGYKLVKELAALGHPDGMCLYGIVLNEGRVSGVDANPEEAVVWFQRCVDAHRHIPSMYELAVALYTGEGVPENPERAVKYFEKAANLHVGAAYMLGKFARAWEMEQGPSKNDRIFVIELLCLFSSDSFRLFNPFR